MLTEKKLLTLDDIEAQTALELPERETPQTAVVTCLAICVGQIIIRDVRVNVAFCATIEAITLGGDRIFECEIRQHGNG
jgi:hypothetical protein